MGLRRSKARYLTVCPKRHQPGGFGSIKSFHDWHDWCFFFFFLDKQVKKWWGLKDEKPFMLFHFLSRVTDFSTDLAYVPYRSLCFALGSVTLYGSDLPASATAACRETAVFYRDRVEPSRRSRGGGEREKKLLMVVLKEMTVENRLGGLRGRVRGCYEQHCLFRNPRSVPVLSTQQPARQRVITNVVHTHE